MLTLVKEVINDNGGTAVASDWTLTAAGYDPVSPDAGTYDLSESGPSGYSASDWVCVGGNQTDADTVNVGLGDDVTCTITNTFTPPIRSVTPGPCSTCLPAIP